MWGTLGPTLAFSAFGLLFVWRIASGIKKHKLIQSIIQRSQLLTMGEMTDEMVHEYIEFLKPIEMPNYNQLWHQLRATFTLVKESPSLSTDAKQALRKLLLNKGVNHI